jgi:undecaprenyl pyrophosphate phosphatase UppP
MTLVREIHFGISEIRFKKTIFSFVVLGVSTASYFFARKCCLNWQYALAFSAISSVFYSFFVSAFYFDKTPQDDAGKKKKEAEKLEKGTFAVICMLALVPYILAFGVCCAGYYIRVAGIVWIFSLIVIFAALIIYGQLMTWRERSAKGETKAKVVSKLTALDLHLWLFHWLAGIRWPG